jgi:DNA-directed RNA polymerase specialized sigma24 family protein
MSEMSVQKPRRKKDWALNPQAFHRLLEWLDQGTNSEGQRYLEVRRRLLAYFDRKNCPAPEELADETLNRVARRLEEEAVIESDSPAKYCYIMARFIFMEHLRRIQKDQIVLGETRLQRRRDNSDLTEADDNRERMLRCLEKCVSKLETLSRHIIVQYYLGEQSVKIRNRRSLAESLGLTMNALSIRACRIRDKLEACVRECVSEE